MNIDLRKTPFSRFGSYSVIQLGKLKEKESNNLLYFRDIGGGDSNLGYIFQINLIDQNKKPIDYEIQANETEIKLIDPKTNEKVSIIFPDERRVRFYSKSLSFSFNFILSSYDHINPLSPSTWELHSYTHEMKLKFTLLEGKCNPDLKWDTIQTTKGILSFTGVTNDVQIERYQCVAKLGKPKLSFEKELILAKKDYEKFLASVPPVKDSLFEKGRALASYITYSSVVHPSGNLNRYAMYMSNNWMTNIWSWDNCFNAIALSKNNEQLALDQLLIFSEVQDESGVLPDFMNNLFCSYACCKPPIQGWAYMKMMSLNDFFLQKEQLIGVFKQLKGIEHYWSTYRTNSSFPLPYYNHGNDSGWDNATPFISGMPVTTPDLPSYLVLLYEALEKISKVLNLCEEEKNYIKKGEQMVKLLIDNLWVDGRFRSYHNVKKSFVDEGDSLIELMPIIISHRLPEKIVSSLVSRLSSASFLTEFGLATEALDSSYYQENGYWRGPIWAPVMLLIIDGLTKIKKDALAKKLARSFCNTAQNNGMTENFDPKTGKGLVDPAFTWTSSVFICLANEYI